MPKIEAVKTLLNLIWLIFGGIWLSLGYIFFGIIACILVVTLPAGVACFRIANYVLWPFGREVVPAPGAGAMSGVSNVIWFLVAGLWLAISHITTAFFQAITIIGIPLAIANIKMIPVTCFPFGKQIVSSDQFSYRYLLAATGHFGATTQPGGARSNAASATWPAQAQ